MFFAKAIAEATQATEQAVSGAGANVAVNIAATPITATKTAAKFGFVFPPEFNTLAIVLLTVAFLDILGGIIAVCAPKASGSEKHTEESRKKYGRYVGILEILRGLGIAACSCIVGEIGLFGKTFSTSVVIFTVWVTISIVLMLVGRAAMLKKQEK